MRRLPIVLLTGFVAVMLVTGNFSGLAPAQKDEKFKGKLPTYWKDIGLSNEQKDKIYKIQGDYYTKTKELRKQLDKLDSEEKQELFKILTSAQKDQLRDIYLKKVGVDPFAPPKTDTEPKKEKQ